ncbi:MAG: VCBS repeat-containing protein [Akkermansiaceae bacterium]|nr:VCBS repeat-containing protein [Akkermansiaceae bacterium]MDG1363331.1 VCBS repeat-containing protein [Akkermansiaceae bacterium]
MASIQKNQKIPAGSRPRQCKPLILIGVVLVAITANFILRRNNSDPTLGSPDKAYLVPAPVETPMNLLDDPNADGWPTEALAEEAKQQLKGLGKLILNPGEINSESLRQFVSDDISFHSLETKDSKPVFSDSALHIVRMPDQPAESKQEGLAKIETALRDLATPLAGGTDLRFTPKVFRVQQDEKSFTTLQYIALSGITENGVIEKHATWRTRWTKKGDDLPPLLTSIEVSDIEQVNSHTPGRTLFSDCTQSVIGSTDSFETQLGHGYGHWLRRTQDTQYFFWLGNPGLALGDVNGDGLDDLYLCQEDGLPNRLYVQNPDGTLSDKSDEAEVNWLEGSRSALLVDLDNDGDQDLAVAMMGGIVLAANQGDGRFKYQTLLPTADDLMSMSAADYDGDGLLDLYVCTYYQNSSDGPQSRSSGVVGGDFVYHDSNSGGPNSLFKNKNAFNFRNVTTETGLDQNNLRWSLAASWEDYDGDGDQDLYVANDFGRNNLFRNDGGKFVDVAAQSGVEDSASGMAVTWGDYNRDGNMDVYVSNMFSAAGNRITYQDQFKPNASPEVRKRLQRFARGSTLMKASGNGSFDDVSEAAGVAIARWAWGTSFADLNNDGWQDILVANGNITGEDPGDL